MKKFTLSIFAVVLFVNAFAQKADHRRPTSIGISFFLSNYEAAEFIRKNGFGDYYRSNPDTKTNPGMTINYLKGLTNNLDFVATFGGSFVDYRLPNVTNNEGNTFILDATASINVKLLPDNFWVVPFATVGIGATRYSGNNAAFAPLGVGLQFNITEDFFLNVNSQYRLPVTGGAAGNLYTGFSAYTLLGKKKAAAQN